MANMEDILLDVDKIGGKPQRRPLFKLKRSGQVLSRQQVKAIKKGRKQLRKELKARGIKSKQEFEMMASSMGLYYDKSRFLAFLGWLLHGRGLWALGAALAALLGALFLYSLIPQMQGHFTINMSDGLFKEGFLLSETADFAHPTTNLFCDPAQDVPCISISHIPADIDENEGQSNENYFAYTFFLRNEGESVVDYVWDLFINSESKDLSKACWVMIFQDGKMRFYAEPGADGREEALPAFGDNSRGYLGAPMINSSRYPGKQYDLISTRGNLEYYRVIPEKFHSETQVAAELREDIAPGDVHKYTIVIWLEGDDPDCTQELVGGHMGLQMDFCLLEEETEESTGGWFDRLWSNLKFWDA